MNSSRNIPFVKAHACGNDFLVVSEDDARRQHAAISSKLCNRHTGVGADGVEFVERRADGTFFLRLFNSDGSEAELSGNGTRCVAAWLAQSEGLQQAEFGTHGGKRTCHVVKQEEHRWLIESQMGVPRVMPRTIQIEGVKGDLAGAMVNVGNPHFVLFPESEDFSVAGLGWQELGAKLSAHPMFRFGTNVEFVRVLADDRIEFRIYERGCGPTTSSGTGTCASSAAAIRMRGVARSLTAVAEGGAQSVEWPADDEELRLTGPAEIICQGEAFFG